MTSEKKKEKERKQKDEEAGLGIRGQVQCKSPSLVNVEGGENVNKQTTAVTHSNGEMHIHTKRRGEEKKNYGEIVGEKNR